MKLIFLHIPKTAGQSIHEALLKSYGSANVCPARNNNQLNSMTMAELNRFKVFSGHFNWVSLDCLHGPKYVFTVLREPQERILSFYFYLRDRAKRASLSQLNEPSSIGLKAILELTPKEYFLGGLPYIRNFIDNHYDNFYTYYFAGRKYTSRNELSQLIKEGKLTYEALLQMAFENIANLDRVYRIDQIADAFDSISLMGGVQHDKRYLVNVNHETPQENRLEELYKLGADTETIVGIRGFCSMDAKIWQSFN